MIEVLASGLLNTVQDLGRFDYRDEGVAVAGAMDKLALNTGNRLLGNEPDAAAIEITMFPFVVRFTEDTPFTVTGAACEVTLDDGKVLPWWVVTAHAGQTLRLARPLVGAIAYLVVGGGIDVPIVLGSRSTDLKIGIGGLSGRPLRKGDHLRVFSPASELIDWPGGFGVEPPGMALALEAESIDAEARTAIVSRVRVLPAGEYEKFPAEMRELFWGPNWSISPNSNRSAFRVSGPALRATGHDDVMYSHGIVPGVIQVPPSGNVMIQMADANTHGGYPKIGAVIEADMWRLAQARLGSALQFVQTTYDAAVEALAAERTYLQAVSRSLDLRGRH